ncbi:MULTISPECIES: SusC/RagA family TonB-linked outer membrane protein [Chitinophagaceae]
MGIHARTKAQRISVSFRDVPLEKVFKEIQRQSGYNFVYNNKVLAGKKNVSIQMKDANIESVLNTALSGQSISYEIIDRTIVLKAVTVRNGTETKLLLNAAVPITINGVVKDSAGNPLESATIRVKGTGKVATTNAGGAFSLDAEEGDVLIISLVGYVSKEVKVSGYNAIVVYLSATPKDAEQVVVTALGIKRSEKALTYNVQEFKSDEVTRNKDANFVNALAGKVAGVTINSSSAGIGGASRVVMRGTKSIQGNNNALYVIDGIPMPSLSGGANSTGAFQGVVSGDGISSINPEDIEKVTILTGPSAAALYGSSASNGVVLVTMKKGTEGRLKVDFSNSTDFFSPFVMPQFQNTYGQSDPAQFASWGAELATPSSYKPKDFFQTGNNIFSSVSLSGGTEKSQTMLSVSSNNATGIIPKNTFNRYNFSLSQSTKYTDRLSADFRVMYTQMDDRNMIAQGQYHNPLLGVYLFPAGDDIEKYRIYGRYDADRKISTQFWPYGNQGLSIENPYWIVYEESNTNKTDRYMLSASVNYKATDWLNITARGKMDNSNITSEVKRPAGTDGLFASQFGFYSTAKQTIKYTYLDIMASVKKDITSGLRFNANIGSSYDDFHYDSLGAGGNLTKLANFYSVAENTDALPTQGYMHKQTQSVFATVELDYNRWLYLNLTGRNEWPSELPKGYATKTNYFYPSVGLSAVLTDALHIPKTVLSYAKVRVSYAEVGNAPQFGITNPVYSLINPNYRPAKPDEYLPEKTKSYEAGVDLKFLHNTLSFTATVYKSNTTNQLLDQYLGTGGLFTDYFFNAGNIENKGIEASLGYNKKWGEFSIGTTVIFSLNRNRIKRLAEGYKNPVTGEIFGQDSIIMPTVGSDLLNILTVNGSMSDLYVTQVLKEDNQGYLWTDPSSGAINKVAISPRYIGHTAPDYNIGWRNSFTYRNFDLSFLIDARLGGIGISYTQSILDAWGVSEQSARDRSNGGVEIYGKRYVNVQNYYNTIGAASGGSVGLAAYYVYSATNVRLRETSFGYTLPSTFFKGKINNIRIAFTGRNLFMFYNKSPFDPESSSSTGTYYQGIDYFRQPSYRSFGFSVRAQF